MSFTTKVKDEISKTNITKEEKEIELAAIYYLNKEIKIATENINIGKRIYQIFIDILNTNLKITVRKGFNYQKNNIFILQSKVKYNYDLQKLEKEELKKSFLRMAFLLTGSLNDPKTSRYHLEFLLDNKSQANYINNIFEELDLNSKILKRENKYMVYIKESEKISDFLKIIKAFNSVLYYEDIRIYRDHKNMTNRLNNCEQANVDKTVYTATNQLNELNYIINKAGLEILEEKEQIIAQYRLKYPDVSLLELSEIITMETGKKITKSGVYHRFKKITEIYNKLKAND